MPNSRNHNRSTPATHSGGAGRDTNASQRQDSSHAQPTSSSRRSRGDRHQRTSTSTRPGGTSEQSLGIGDAQASLPSGWIELNGIWYYPTPDGDYSPWNNVRDAGEDGPEQYEMPADNVGGLNGHFMNAGQEYNSWDETSAASSRNPNQGSGYLDSAQDGTEVDHRNEEYPDVQDHFQGDPGSWSSFDTHARAAGAQYQGDMAVDVSHTDHGQFEAVQNEYPRSIELETEEDQMLAVPGPPHA